MPLPLIAWAAGAALLAAVGGAYAWLFGRGARLPEECRGKVRIWVVGPTGVGKTVLTRAVLLEPMATAPGGSPRTARLEWHWQADQPLALADTVGLELVGGPGQVEKLAGLLEDLDDRPHAAWICVREGAHRVFGGDAATGGGTEAALARLLHTGGVPCIGVLTQAEPGSGTTGAMADAMRAAMPDLATIVPVCVLPRLDEDGVELVPRHGLDGLRAATIAAMATVEAERLARDWVPYGW